MITIEKKPVTVESYILDLLAPIGDISIENNNICKGGKKFGILRDEEIYLLIESGEFVKLDNHILKKKDEFLQLATKSYWIASGKI